MDETNGTNLTCFALAGNVLGLNNFGSMACRRCRLCVSNEIMMVPIFSMEGKKLELAYRINKLLPTMVTQMDRLPQEVCRNCITELNTAFEFVTKCMINQAKLRKILNVCTKESNIPIEVFQEYSAHWPKGDSVENISSSRKFQISKKQCIPGNEDSIKETERNEPMEKINLVCSNESQGKIISSKSMDSADAHEMESKLDHRSLDVENHDGTVDNNSVIETNTTETKELAVNAPQKNSAVNEVLDVHRILAEVKHVCKYCEKGFTWKADLFNHQTSEHPEFVIRCRYCLKVYYDKKELESHELAHRNFLPPGQIAKNMQYYNCSNNKKRRHKITSKSLGNKNGLIPSEDSVKSTESKSINSDDKNKSNQNCNYCNVAFPSMKLQRRHMRREHKLRLPCRFCSTTCISIYELRRHESRHKKDAVKRQLFCNECGKFLYYTDDLREHELIHLYKHGLKCEICGEVFISEVSLEEHIKIHGGESNYLCETCGQNFDSFFIFRVHKMSHIYPDFQMCQLCNSCFHSMADLETHMDTYHTKKTIPCTVCEQAFTSLELLKEHKATHKNSVGYKCESCGKTFQTVRKLRNHTESHSSERNYLCDKCGKDFKANYTLQNHRNFCQVSVSCSVCSRIFSGPDNSNRLQIHMRLHTGEKPHLCAVCGKRFHAMWSLKQHMVTHETPQIPCQICGILFTRKSYMLTHMKRHRVPCNICGQVFANMPILLAHQKTHTGENDLKPADKILSKGHKCDDCGKMFVTALDLKKHKPMHSEERPYKCNLCNKSYRRLKDLAKHTVSIHTTPKPYQCRLCSCSFDSKQTLLKHEKGHTAAKPYVCQVCGLGFWYPLAIEKHIIKHSAVSTTGQMYDCKYCEKSFAQKSTLIMHRRTHSAHLTYGCSFCPRKFSRLRFMRRHRCAFDPNRRAKSSTSQMAPLPSLSPLIEEAPTLVAECTVLQHEQPESQCGGGDNNISTESVVFLKHLNQLVKANEVEDASCVSSSANEGLDEEVGEPVHPHLRYSDSSKNVTLVSDIPVYIRKQAFDVLSKSRMSSTTLARKLLEEVFTEDALLECSVKGQRPNSTNKIKKRESLFSSGIDAIISFVHKTNEFQGKPTVKNADLVSAMGHRLNEIRRMQALTTKASLETLTIEVVGGEQFL